MPFYSRNGIRFFVFESLTHFEVTHAVFTRRGGYSQKPWESLNVGGLVGDHPGNVEMNRRKAFDTIGRDPASMFDVWQIHSAKVVCVDSPRLPKEPHLKADAILTNSPDVTLFMRFADCVPILLYDPVVKAAGLVHSGWQGTVKKIAVAAVQEMIGNYGSKIENIRAGIGPSICVDHYDVGPDVAQKVMDVFSVDGSRILVEKNHRVRLDLWEANRILLTQAGINRIEVSGICTACHLNDWYSHRGENGKTGRFGVLIGLRN
jgi:YfiH family protein